MTESFEHVSPTLQAPGSEMHVLGSPWSAAQARVCTGYDRCALHRATGPKDAKQVGREQAPCAAPPCMGPGAGPSQWAKASKGLALASNTEMQEGPSTNATVKADANGASRSPPFGFQRGY